MKRLIISNITQFQGITNQHPDLLNIQPFTILRDIFKSPVKSGGCSKCSARASMLANYRPQFEASFAMLSEAERLRMKDILKVDSLCYNHREANGKLILTCF